MEIIKAEARHFDEIHELLCSLEGHGFDREILRGIFLENLDNPDIFYIAATDGAKITGFASLHVQKLLHHAGKIAEVQEIVVDERFRSQGIGALLLERLKFEAVSRGCSLLEVCCNQQRTLAHEFYNSLGLQNTHYKFTLELDMPAPASAPAESSPMLVTPPIPAETAAAQLDNPLEWYNESIFYHIYPLGFCDALDSPRDGVNRIGKIAQWIPHMKELGINALYLGPVFESDYHGYDTCDYAKIDARLGTNRDFAEVCGQLRAAGIKVVLDGVFNHAGRGFVQFQDVVRNRESSAFKDWFGINFGGNSNYNDGLWYEGWEGHYELVKLNLKNSGAVDYLLECVRGWISDFGIDGLRLDVAYLLDKDFMRRLRGFTKEIKPDFFLLGECLHGDYNQFVSPDLLDSCTNYECYKGLYSSFNEMNMFEIAHSLNRQFGAENWTLYKGKHLLAFVDNHDVSRIATILREPAHLPLVYALLFAMPGIPCMYYGSEWGIVGDKNHGDGALRPAPENPVENDLTAFIARLCTVYMSQKALAFGGYKQLMLTNRQFVFERTYNGERVIIAINADSAPFDADIKTSFKGTELLTGKPVDINGKVTLPPFSASIYHPA